ncbi:hypothetical protein ACWEKM_44975 [Streptomyces sp. NPDC004752]
MPLTRTLPDAGVGIPEDTAVIGADKPDAGAGCRGPGSA